MKSINHKLSAIVLSLMIVGVGMPMSARLTDEQIKERKEIQKSSKKALKEKASKAARKEAKKLKKEGWEVSPGALPIEKQLDRSYMMQMEYDSDLFPTYIMAEGMSIGQNYDAAKMQAIEIAKQNLASQIETEVNALIDNSVANQQISPEQAASLVKSVSASTTQIQQSLGRILPIVELYRTLPNKNKEVLVRIAYSEEMARNVALKAVKAELAVDAKDLHEKLDNILGLD